MASTGIENASRFTVAQDVCSSLGFTLKSSYRHPLEVLHKKNLNLLDIAMTQNDFLVPLYRSPWFSSHCTCFCEQTRTTQMRQTLLSSQKASWFTVVHTYNGLCESWFTLKNTLLSNHLLSEYSKSLHFEVFSYKINLHYSIMDLLLAGVFSPQYIFPIVKMQSPSFNLKVIKLFIQL